ncbi:MAG: hypothetical protein NWQ31_11970, partial [Polaribacter sp.]|nr:hypothetical protein [Polaribacter sp.]
DGNATRLLILKIDYDGNLIWRKFYDFEPSHIGYGSIIEHSNGYVFTGENTIIKINKDGDIIWYKLNKDFIKDNTSITSLNVDSENNIYIIGKRSSEEPQKGSEGVISKINSFGELIWEKKFKISLFDNFYDLTINSNDEIFILGTTETKGA